MTWSLVNASGTAISGAVYGSISEGVYTAPSLVPATSQNDFYVKATSTVDPTRFATALIHLVPAPLLPARGPTSGGTRVTITGANFSSATEVYFGENAGSAISIQSSTQLSVTTPPSTLTNLIGVTDVKIVIGNLTVLYPNSFHYGASLLRLGGGVLVPTCQGSYYVAVGDLNGDGKPDLATTCFNQQIEVMFNNGEDAVNAPVTIASPDTTDEFFDIQIADLNNDQKPDIVVSYADGIMVFANDGAGGFNALPLIPYPLGQYQYDVYMAFADLNGDGMPDLAYTLPETNQVAVAINEGSGHFGAPTLLSMGTTDYPYSIFAGNIRPATPKLNDIVVSYVETAAVTSGGALVFLNGGTGTFAAGVAYPTKNFVYSIAVGDFNKDGIPDLAIGSESGDGKDLAVYFGAGDGTFKSRTYYPDNTGNSGVYFRSLSAADADGDGFDDVIMNRFSSVNLFYGSASTPMFLNTASSYGMTNGPNQVVVANLGTGPQVIGADYNDFEMYLNAGNRQFGAAVLPIGTSPDSIDLLWGSATVPSVVAALQMGNATANGGSVGLASPAGLLNVTKTGSTQKFDLPAESAAMRVVSADVTGDQLNDAIVVDDGSGTPYVPGAPLHGSLWILPGLQAGGLGNTAAEGMQQIKFTGSVSDVEVADLNGDGFPDLVVATNNAAYSTQCEFCTRTVTSGAVQVLWGKAGGGFSAPQTVSAGVLPFRITLADLDGDGRPEIVTADQSGNQVVIVRFTGTKSQEPIYVPVGQFPSAIIVADVNGDYIPDLIVLAQYQSVGLTEIDVLLGQGLVQNAQGVPTLQFNEPERYRFVGQATDMALGDVDGDGLADINVAEINPGAVAVLRGADGGQFLDPELAPVGGNPSSIRLVDFTGSGLLDVVVGDTSNNALRPMVNQSR